MWKGSLSFGLVNIPIAVYLATEGKEFSFNQLCEKAHKIRYKKWCPVEEREVSYSEIKKGYEISKNSYVVIEKQDLDGIKLKTTSSIDIKEFVDEKEVDPILIEKSYYVAPDNKKNKNDKAYSLLVKVLTDTKKVAVGKVVLRDKEHLVVIRPYQRELVMHILHYQDEIRPADEISELNEIQKVSLDSKELSLGKLLVENLSSEHLDLSKYSDTYTKELEKLIDSKVKGKPLVEKPMEKVQETQDLVAALKASLQQKTKVKAKG
jgi:DNA end-binding protein Ku